MQLKFMKTILPQQDGAAKVCAVSWSQNNQKLAVATADRLIVLFDEHGEKKDKFATKPVDAKYGKKSYVVKDVTFSPDSTKLAVGQSDCIVFVYKIGQGWNEKKVICNKFPQQSAVTCMAWPTDSTIILGCADGKVRLANAKTNKSSTLYNTDVYVCSLVVGPGGKGLLSGHADGSVVRFFFDAKSANGGQQGKKICSHPCPPYGLAWTANGVLAAGCDRRIISYNQDGRVMQQFDYSRYEHESDFTRIAASPSGQAAVAASFDRLRLITWNTRRGAWDEAAVSHIANLYTISALAWKPDGSRLVCGALCGNVEMFDCAVKKSLIRNKFELTYVGPSQVIVKELSGNRRAVLRSDAGDEIEDVKVMGQDRYAVAHTSASLIFADLETSHVSQVSWPATTGNEKFYFECENVCMIFNAGELSLVEYGKDDILVSVRTEFTNPHLISVRLNERQHKGSEESKRMAYLIDIKTIQIMDLQFGSNIGQVAHDSKLDWLELNETGKRLLFRDKRYRLCLYNIDTDEKKTLLSYCSYVQWVTGSDVVVAQNRENLCVWYSIETPDQMSIFPIKGDIVDVIREDGQTNVMVQEGIQLVAYTLDEGLIEFGTAMEDGDFGRAITYLEQLDLSADTEAMWQQMGRLALEQRQLAVAQRCYAALCDVSRAHYLAETSRLIGQLGVDGTQHYKVRARLAMMAKEFKLAESVYLEQNCLDEAIEMYQSLHKWDEALELAENRSHPDIDSLKTKYYRYLADSGQDEKAAEVKEKEGDYMAAIDLYLKANLPTRAAKLLTEHEHLMQNLDLVQSIAAALIKSELYDRAGDLYEKTRDFSQALDCYRRGAAFNKAVELSRYSFPEEVIKLEEEWGDYLLQQKQIEQAINHYIESGKTLKALDAAVKARQWNKAVQIIDSVESPELAKDYYGKIAEHYASSQDYERAERFFIEAGLQKEAVEMYNRAGRWQEAHRLASEFLESEQSAALYAEQAGVLEAEGRLAEAAELYCATGQPNKAIAMYKQAGHYEAMMRLVERYHAERVQDTHVHLAKEMEEEGRLVDAERYYLNANDWKSAVSMYRAAEQWDDAYRLAKQHGGEVAQRQVAYLWAKHLGGDSAVKLLNKFNLLEVAIDYASDNGAFDFAFEMCRLGLKWKMETVHYKKALQLEEDGQTAEAEQHFLLANKPKEAVLMYVHQQDWDAAQRLAEHHCPEAIGEVYVGQARLAFEQRDYARAESYLLRAQRPEIIVKTYKELGMWNEALRVCRDYLPNLLNRLQEEYDQEQLKSGAKGAESYLAQAKDWEAQADYERAIAAYLKVCQPLTNNEQMMEKAWTKAADLAVKFLPEEQGTQVVHQVADVLQQINKFHTAAEVLLQGGLAREAIDCFISGGEWSKAKKVAVQVDRDLENYVDERYKQFLRDQGKAEELATVDVISAIDMHVEKGQWNKALDIAKEQQNAALLNKYVALRCSELISDSKFDEAIELFVKYGTSANKQNFNMYKRLIDETIAKTMSMVGADTYRTWAALRNMLLNLVEQLRSSQDETLDGRYVEVFDRFLTVAHWYALRSALLCAGADADAAFKLFATKISVGLLRYTDLLLADKAFYEAGLACREFGGRYESMAFVFMNHYLDLAEAIEEQNVERVDNSHFTGTDIPLEVSLPEKLYPTEDDHEEVKDWVLAVSVDKQVEMKLLTDARGVYEASALTADGSVALPICVVTSYPIIEAAKQFGNSKKFANKDDWNKLIMVQKSLNSEEIKDTLSFISQWTGTETGVAL